MESGKETGSTEGSKFLVDENAGKLAGWLRMMGYDTVFFQNGDDSEMVARALAEDRIILTRDTGLIERGVVSSGRVRVILIESDVPESQIRQVADTLELDFTSRPFSRCLECNQPLEYRKKSQVKNRVPPYVWKTRDQYMECPVCHRIYWRGTHWEAMTRKLQRLAGHRRQRGG